MTGKDSQKVRIKAWPRLHRVHPVFVLHRHNSETDVRRDIKYLLDAALIVVRNV